MQGVTAGKIRDTMFRWVLSKQQKEGTLAQATTEEERALALG